MPEQILTKPYKIYQISYAVIIAILIIGCIQDIFASSYTLIWLFISRGFDPYWDTWFQAVLPDFILTILFCFRKTRCIALLVFLLYAMSQLNFGFGTNPFSYLSHGQFTMAVVYFIWWFLLFVSMIGLYSYWYWYLKNIANGKHFKIWVLVAEFIVVFLLMCTGYIFQSYSTNQPQFLNFSSIPQDNSRNFIDQDTLQTQSITATFSDKARRDAWIQQMKTATPGQDNFKGCTYSSSNISKVSQGWQVHAIFSCSKLPPETWQHRLVKSIFQDS